MIFIRIAFTCGLVIFSGWLLGIGAQRIEQTDEKMSDTIAGVSALLMLLGVIGIIINALVAVWSVGQGV